MVRRETYCTTITDCNDAVEQELSYDAWGNRRDPNTWIRNWNNPVYEEPMFDRGYTGHEHLYAFGLINMNGRCYDPVMSSFLSVDAYVQSPDNSQNFNRYSYCLNNPLKYTDPSGWQLSLPNGHGVAPPPDGDEVGNYITGVYTNTGFSSEYNSYTYSYGLSEVTVTPYGNTWAQRRCKELVWENNGGGHSAEYDGGVVNVPILSGGVGGALGQKRTDNNSTTNNVNIDISQGMISTSGLYLQIEKILAYSETLGTWTDKMGKRRPLTKNGNQYTGGKLKYGKAMSTKFGKASNRLAGLGMIISGVQCYNSTSIDQKIEYGADVLVGGIGLLPGGAGISVFWFFGGRELVFQYGNTMVEMMNNGINPGLPEYQPFK